MQNEQMTSEDVLVVVSKLKKYVKDSTGLSTAGTVPNILTDMIRKVCEEAAENAKKDGRKTLMDRDFSCMTQEASNTTSNSQTSCCNM